MRLDASVPAVRPHSRAHLKNKGVVILRPSTKMAEGPEPIPNRLSQLNTQLDQRNFLTGRLHTHVDSKTKTSCHPEAIHEDGRRTSTHPNRPSQPRAQIDHLRMRKSLPLISPGAVSPITPSNVGAISRNAPPARNFNLSSSVTNTNGTGFVV